MKEDAHIGEPFLFINIHDTKAGTIEVKLNPEHLKTTKN